MSNWCSFNLWLLSLAQREELFFHLTFPTIEGIKRKVILIAIFCLCKVNHTFSASMFGSLQMTMGVYIYSDGKKFRDTWKFSSRTLVSNWLELILCISCAYIIRFYIPSNEQYTIIFCIRKPQNKIVPAAKSSMTHSVQLKH